MSHCFQRGVQGALAGGMTRCLPSKLCQRVCLSGTLSKSVSFRHTSPYAVRVAAFCMSAMHEELRGGCGFRGATVPAAADQPSGDRRVLPRATASGARACRFAAARQAWRSPAPATAPCPPQMPPHTPRWRAKPCLVQSLWCRYRVFSLWRVEHGSRCAGATQVSYNRGRAHGWWRCATTVLEPRCKPRLSASQGCERPSGAHAAVPATQPWPGS